MQKTTTNELNNETCEKVVNSFFRIRIPRKSVPRVGSGKRRERQQEFGSSVFLVSFLNFSVCRGFCISIRAVFKRPDGGPPVADAV